MPAAARVRCWHAPVKLAGAGRTAIRSRMAGRCPACGSADRTELAPGLWQCAGQVQQEVWVDVPNERGPRNPMTGEPLTRTREPRVITSTCPHTYQEWVAASPPPPTCSNCGQLFSVRACADCSAALCGRAGCASVRHGRLQCPSCARMADAAQAERDAVDRARRREEQDRRRDARARQDRDREQQHAEAVRARETAGRPVHQIRTEIHELTRATQREPRSSSLFDRITPSRWILAWFVLCGVAFVVTTGGDDSKANGWVLIPLYLAIALALFAVAGGPRRRRDRIGRRLERLRVLERELGCGADSCRACYPSAAS